MKIDALFETTQKSRRELMLSSIKYAALHYIFCTAKAMARVNVYAVRVPEAKRRRAKAAQAILPDELRRDHFHFQNTLTTMQQEVKRTVTRAIRNASNLGADQKHNLGLFFRHLEREPEMHERHSRVNPAKSKTKTHFGDEQLEIRSIVTGKLLFGAPTLTVLSKCVIDPRAWDDCHRTSYYVHSGGVRSVMRDARTGDVISIKAFDGKPRRGDFVKAPSEQQMIVVSVIINPATGSGMAPFGVCMDTKWRNLCRFYHNLMHFNDYTQALVTSIIPDEIVDSPGSDPDAAWRRIMGDQWHEAHIDTYPIGEKKLPQIVIHIAELRGLMDAFMEFIRINNHIT